MKAFNKQKLLSISIYLFLHLVNSEKVDFQNSFLKDGEIFDFIVVGGGLAGCVVASRLAESGRHTVLLIEEGGIPNPNLDVPGFADFFNSQKYGIDVKIYNSVPQRNAALAQNGIIQYPIGKTMGGGSSVNGMMWNRGHPEDYNNWGRLTNDESWSYENLLKYFRKSENYTGFNPTTQRGYNGPIGITTRISDAPGLEEVLQAGQEIGYPIGDPNGPQIPSISLVDFSINREGKRVSAYSGYIRPLLKKGSEYSKNGKRSNLLILLNTTVKRVIFNGNEAVGVIFTVNNSSKTGYAKARKEIVISAGALDSPALLMRSGIGPKDILEKANIPVMKALPVGRNLQDHVVTTLTVIYGNRSAVLVPSRDYTEETWRLYQETGRGPYSIPGGVVAQGFFLSSFQERSLSSWPDLYLAPLHIEVEKSPEVQDLKEWEVIVTWAASVARPKSRGFVFLNPEDVDGPPIFDFRYLTHPNDMQVMLEAVKVAEELCERTSAMQRIRCRFPSIPLSACSHLKFRSEAYWRCYIRQKAGSGIHVSGTCRMGSGPEDPEAVVDSQLKVIGVDRLSVVDASVINTLTTANTQAPVYAIAEKASDLILKRWEKINR